MPVKPPHPLHKHTLHKTLNMFGIKATKQSVIEGGFFTLQGLFAGIVINDVWRVFNLPGENIPVKIDGENTSHDWDYLFQMGIGFALMAGEYVLHMKHFGPFGAGVVMGATLANKSEGTHSKETKNKGTYIGFG